MLELELTPRADQDLLDIWLYTAEAWSPLQADKYSDEFFETFQTLCSMPNIARERPDFDPPVRVHPTGQHLIVYRCDTHTLTVVRIVAQRQNWSAILSK